MSSTWQQQSKTMDHSLREGFKNPRHGNFPLRKKSIKNWPKKISFFGNGLSEYRYLLSTKWHRYSLRLVTPLAGDLGLTYASTELWWYHFIISFSEISICTHISLILVGSACCRPSDGLLSSSSCHLGITPLPDSFFSSCVGFLLSSPLPPEPL